MQKNSLRGRRIITPKQIQYCRGEFDKPIDTSDGYAQTDPHMSEMENEAYLLGNRLVRNFEDNKKLKNERLYEALKKRFTGE